MHYENTTSLVPCVKVSKQRLVYYDSLHGDGSKYLSQVKEFLQVESVQKGYKGLDPKNWLAFMDKYITNICLLHTEFLQTIAMQQNAYDCGLFLCRFAEIASRMSQMNCVQQDVNRFRKQMAIEVAAGALQKN
uniref:Ubiquitin-like protease family profile domain-containing protein n=1 Tax=Ditylenchus dipsaci TaxID=166011 RepID=A0A915DZI0_9BILA